MHSDIFDVSEKVIIVTGALGLIGLEYAKILSYRGARVMMIDVFTETEARTSINKNFSGESRSRVTYFQGNITDKESLQSIRQEIIKQYHKIDVLINNAAINPKVEGTKKRTSTKKGFEDLALDDWERELKVNLTGTMLCCQIFGAVMKSGGSVINIASTYGIVAPDQSLYPKGFVKTATYGVSKGAIINLTKYLATYWGKKGIRVNAVAPGGVYNGQDKNFVKKYSAKTPLGRMAKAHEYNGIIVYLASDASSYSTGALYVVDGGWTAW